MPPISKGSKRVIPPLPTPPNVPPPAMMTPDATKCASHGTKVIAQAPNSGRASGSMLSAVARLRPEICSRTASITNSVELCYNTSAIVILGEICDRAVSITFLARICSFSDAIAGLD